MVGCPTFVDCVGKVVSPEKSEFALQCENSPHVAVALPPLLDEVAFLYPPSGGTL